MFILKANLEILLSPHLNRKICHNVNHSIFVVDLGLEYPEREIYSKSHSVSHAAFQGGRAKYYSYKVILI